LPLLLHHNAIEQLGFLVAKQKLKKHSLRQQPGQGKAGRA
jgi:hypothetical protein